ncbi:MAG: 5'-3' exonuclease H3TH domain-containing protein, partial [Desulfobacterales bacterium]
MTPTADRAAARRDGAPTLYLIDGTAYIHRAFHAIHGLANSKGLPTNAVFGFTRMLIKLMAERQPEYAAMLFDAKGPTFRHERYEAYKANRPPMAEDMAVQIPLIKRVTRGFNLPLVEMAGFEADDLIGTLARQAQEKGFFVVMVTGDKDFMQLVTETAVIWDPMKEKTVDRAAVRAAMGIEPGQVVEVMGLSGDSTDNIPGVPGIGPKTAQGLIQSFGSMAALYADLDKLSAKKQQEKLAQYREQAFLSRELATIETRAPLAFDPAEYRLRPPDSAVLAALFKELEFRQLQKDYPQGADHTRKDYRLILDEEALAALVARLEKAERFALDTETTSQYPMKARLVGLSFAVQADQGFYIPCGHDYPGAPAQLSLKTVLSRLKPLLENPSVPKVGQNIKYDWIVLARHGVRLAGVVFDTMLA